MTLDQYQEAVRGTQPEMLSDEKLEHAVFGLASQAGKAAGILQKIYQGYPHPLTSRSTEKSLSATLGEALWMISEAADAIGVSLDYIANINAKKSKALHSYRLEMESSKEDKA